MKELDGTAELSVLGANAVLSVSIAAALAVADGAGEPLFRSVAEGRRPV